MRTSIRRVLVAWALLALGAVACNDTSTNPNTSTPPAPRGDIVIKPSSLDFGTVCVGQSKTMSFKVYAPPSNNEKATGIVETPGKPFTITSGAGDFSLDPGDSLTVSVKYAPSSEIGDFDQVKIGSHNVDLSGAGSNYIFYALTPTGGISAKAQTNYTPFASAVLSSPGGVSYSNPSWDGCGSAWIIDGNPIAESKVEVKGLKVPAGVKSLLVTVKMDASNSCAQLLIEINGAETVKKNLSTSCGTHSYRITWPSSKAGTYTLGIGTNQQALTCFADIAIDFVKFTFEGYCNP